MSIATSCTRVFSQKKEPYSAQAFKLGNAKWRSLPAHINELPAPSARLSYKPDAASTPQGTVAPRRPALHSFGSFLSFETTMEHVAEGSFRDGLRRLANRITAEEAHINEARVSILYWRRKEGNNKLLHHELSAQALLLISQIRLDVYRELVTRIHTFYRMSVGSRPVSKAVLSCFKVGTITVNLCKNYYTKNNPDNSATPVSSQSRLRSQARRIYKEFVMIGTPRPSFFWLPADTGLTSCAVVSKSDVLSALLIFDDQLISFPKAPVRTYADCECTAGGDIMRVEQQVPLAEPTVNIYNINIAPTTIVDLSLCPTTPVIVNPPQSFDIGVGEDGINIDTGSGPIDSSRGCASDATTEVASSIAQTGFQTAFDDYRPLLAVNDLAGIENDQGLRLVGDGFLSPSIGKQHPRGPFTFKPVLDTQQASCKPTDGVVKLHCTMSKIAFTRQDKSSVMCVGNAVKTHLQSEVAANYVEVVADFPRGTPYDFMEPFAVSGFFSNAREIVIAGTYNIVHIESILKGCVKASSIEMLNFGLTSPIGRLRGMLHLMPLGMGSLKFDCTKTDNSLFVDNIHAIRHFHQRSEELNEKTTNLASLLLIVGDVPIEKELEKAAQTLAYALKPNGTATMLTRQALDDATILALQRTGFTYCGLTDYELPHLQAFRLYEATHSITQVRVIFGFLADNE